MDSSTESTNSASRVSGRNNIFKRSVKTVIPDFEVSLNESTTLSNKADLDMDVSSSSCIPKLFIKPKTPLKQVFNVSLDKSTTDTEIERSMIQPKFLFKKVNNSVKDVFNVSYNATNRSNTLGESSLNETDSMMIAEKPNIFTKKKGITKDTFCEKKSKVDVSFTKDDEVTLKSNKAVLEKLDSDNTNSNQDDSTTSVTKTNPFKKTQRQYIASEKENFDSLHVSFSEETNNQYTKDGLPKNYLNSSKTSDLEPTAFLNRSNPFKKKTDFRNKTFDGDTNKMKVTYMEEETDQTKNIEEVNKVGDNIDKSNHTSGGDGYDENNEEEIMESKTEVLKGSDRSTENLGNNRNASYLTNKTTSEMLLNQSSFNDDNLNNWMSDQSDEDMPLPDIAPVTANISLTKEQIQEEKRASCLDVNTLSWEQKFENIISNSKKELVQEIPKTQKESIKKQPRKVEKKKNSHETARLKKPASFVSKKLYQYIINRLKPKYGIDSVIEAEQLIITICETVKVVCRRKAHQKKLIQDLKKDLAKAGLIETTVDFYEFVIKFLPYSFRIKVVPCIQPVTSNVFPPKDVTNPFDKIL